MRLSVSAFVPLSLIRNVPFFCKAGIRETKIGWRWGGMARWWGGRAGGHRFSKASVCVDETWSAWIGVGA